jgi:hypothetical protein
MNGQPMSGRRAIWRISAFVIAIVGVLAACSDRQVYESLQARERSECAKQPPNLYRACIERADMSYEEYQRAREENDGDREEQ